MSDKTKIFDDGILEATLYPSKWVFCRWLNQNGRLGKTLIKDLNDIERYIYKLKLHGWFTDSELSHVEFHKLLVKFGAMPREAIGDYVRFIKPISSLTDLHFRLDVSNRSESLDGEHRKAIQHQAA